MKLHIELSEEDIKIKLDELIGERVKSITDEYIEKSAQAIVDKKLERMDLTKQVGAAARALIIECCGHPSNSLNNRYMQILRDTAMKMFKDKMSER